jgi:transcriptional regulator with XRE-family HTH domain
MRTTRTPVRGRRIYRPATIAERRRALGLTQRDLARIMRLTLSRVENYEQRRRHPTPDMLGALADALKCTVDDFFVRAEGIDIAC